MRGSLPLTAVHVTWARGLRCKEPARLCVPPVKCSRLSSWHQTADEAIITLKAIHVSAQTPLPHTRFLQLRTGVTQTGGATCRTGLGSTKGREVLFCFFRTLFEIVK